MLPLLVYAICQKYRYGIMALALTSWGHSWPLKCYIDTVILVFSEISLNVLYLVFIEIRKTMADFGMLEYFT